MERRFTLSSIHEGLDDGENEVMQTANSFSSDLQDATYVSIGPDDSVSTARPYISRPSMVSQDHYHFKQCDEAVKAYRHLKFWCIVIGVINAVFFLVVLFVIFYIIIDKPNSNNTPINIYQGVQGTHLRGSEGSYTRDESDKSSESVEPNVEAITSGILKDLYYKDVEMSCDDILDNLNKNYTKRDNCSLIDVTLAAKQLIDSRIQNLKPARCSGRPVLHMNGSDPGWHGGDSISSSMRKWDITSKQVFTYPQNGAITAPQAGVYYLHSQLSLDGYSPDVRQSVQLRRSGSSSSNFKRTEVGTKVYIGYKYSTISLLESAIHLEKGDTIRIIFVHPYNTTPLQNTVTFFKI